MRLFLVFSNISSFSRLPRWALLTSAMRSLCQLCVMLRGKTDDQCNVKLSIEIKIPVICFVLLFQSNFHFFPMHYQPSSLTPCPPTFLPNIFRAKRIQNRAVVNESPTERLVKELKAENARLLQRLSRLGHEGRRTNDETSKTHWPEKNNIQYVRVGDM